MDEPFTAYMPSTDPSSAYYSRTAGQSHPTKAGGAAYVLNGTQRGYEVDDDNKAGYWSTPGHLGGSPRARAPAMPIDAGLSQDGGVNGGLMGAPKAGVAAAQQLAYYDAQREARVAELHSKLGIDKVVLHRKVDDTPMAGHHTTA